MGSTETGVVAAILEAGISLPVESGGMFVIDFGETTVHCAASFVSGRVG